MMENVLYINELDMVGHGETERIGDSVKNIFHHYLCRKQTAAEWRFLCMIM